jgi:hypothetical protein
MIYQGYLRGSAAASNRQAAASIDPQNLWPGLQSTTVEKGR